MKWEREKRIEMDEMHVMRVNACDDDKIPGLKELD